MQKGILLTKYEKSSMSSEEAEIVSYKRAYTGTLVFFCSMALTFLTVLATGQLEAAADVGAVTAATAGTVATGAGATLAAHQLGAVSAVHKIFKRER